MISSGQQRVGLRHFLCQPGGGTTRRKSWFSSSKGSRSAMSRGASCCKQSFAVSSGVDEDEIGQYRRDLKWELKKLGSLTRFNQILADKMLVCARTIDLLVIRRLAAALKQAVVFDGLVSAMKTGVESGNRRGEKCRVVIKCADCTVVKFDGRVSGMVAPRTPLLRRSERPCALRAASWGEARAPLNCAAGMGCSSQRKPISRLALLDCHAGG